MTLLMTLLLLGIVVSNCSKEKSFEKGNGSNGLRSTEYTLGSVNGSGVDGRILISENADSSFNVLVNLNSSVPDTVHVLHIHNGSPDSPGTIAVALSSVKGTDGAVESLTSNIREVLLPDNTMQPMTYEGILGFTGYVDVHFSAQTDSLIAQGKIGN